MRTRYRFLVFVVFAVILAAIPLMNFTQPVFAQSGCGTGVTHQVAAGDNLFRISLRYGTTMAAIAAANGINNYNVIYRGQILAIPCSTGYTASTDMGILNTIPSSGVIYIPVTITPGPQVITVTGGAAVGSCAALRPTSPTDGMNHGMQTFYWDPIPGVTTYRVNVYNMDLNPGELRVSFDTSGLRSRLSGDVSEGYAGKGYQFYWEVQAIVNGQVACTSRPVINWRAAPPTPQPPTATP